MESLLVWEETMHNTLVLDAGQLASSFYLPALVGINPVPEFGYNVYLKTLMVLNSDCPQIMMFIKRAPQARLRYTENPNYVYDVDEDGVINTRKLIIIRIAFNIPIKFHADYHLFAAGNYSMMSDEAKAAIHEHTFAKYKQPGHKGHLIYDKRLLVLEKAPLLRDFMQRMLDTTIDKDAELLDKPGIDSYYIES